MTVRYMCMYRMSTFASAIASRSSYTYTRRTKVYVLLGVSEYELIELILATG